MAKRTIVTEKERLMDARWINTPFSFAQLGKKLTLLQMQVLLKVSEHLQDYLTQFFRAGRHLSKDDPLSLFDDATLLDIPAISIPLKDFGVPVNQRQELYDAIEQVFQLSIRIVVEKEDKVNWSWINVFSFMDYKSNIFGREYRNGNLKLKLNGEAAKWAFNMKLGYINHPSSLAENSSQLYAPRLYFLIKHKYRKSKTTVTIDYNELREELGVDIKDVDVNDSAKPNAGGSEPTVKLHVKFSKFKERVLDPAVADINSLADRNLLDIIVSYVINYPPGVTRGNPDSITFNVKLSKLGEYHKDPKTARQHMQITSGDDTPAVTPRRRTRPRKVVPVDESQQTIDFGTEPAPAPEQSVKVGEKAEEWKSLVAEYADGSLADLLSKATYIGTNKGAFFVQMPDYLSSNELVSATSKDMRFKELLAKYLPEQPEMFRIRITFAKH